jgi:uncharacterized protein
MNKSIVNLQKNFFLLFFLTFFSLAFSNQRIFDNAQILSVSNKTVLEKFIGDWEKMTNHQMAIYTIKSLEGESIENFAVKKFEELGIGSKENNDGLLFLVAINDRQIRIEVGYGLEQYLPDGLVGQIRDKHILSHFRNQDFPLGIMEGTYALLLQQASREGYDISQLNVSQPTNVATKQVSSTQNNIAGLLFLFIIFIILMKSRTGRSLLFMMLLSNSMGSRGGIGRNNFGSFGGGFGSFGGGLSGGGGVSGRW